LEIVTQAMERLPRLLPLRPGASTGIATGPAASVREPGQALQRRLLAWGRDEVVGDFADLANDERLSQKGVLP
jgi:hypothetical protein